ncbi:MAG: small basic protein [Candidatus Omnitrophica bacterium]|nr:small basic protein [Candidatus Omnitrophota bacterium]MBU0895433.1 small basic protein [Candidatus Omnitrophota bacterium]MBU1038234.1 small basic protein [Candidatus Omnitrophota bacterium]
MSQHPSLRSSDKDKALRSVLKRYERVKILKDKEKWTDKDSVYKLPKLKVAKFKVKKEKVVAEDAAAEGAIAAPGAAVAAPGAKAAPVKAAGKPAGVADAKKTTK